MTSPEPVEAADQIDPQWWESLLDEEPGEFKLPEETATRFEERLKQDDLGELERQVLECLAVASSARLEPDSSTEPFRAMVEWHGRRSPLPSDLDTDQLALLGRIAPMIKSPSLRARVADVAWSYGDVRAGDLLNLAIEAYRAAPLDRDHWARITEKSWRRAIQLAKRLGRRRGEVIVPMCESMRDLLLTAEVDVSLTRFDGHPRSGACAPEGCSSWSPWARRSQGLVVRSLLSSRPRSSSCASAATGRWVRSRRTSI